MMPDTLPAQRKICSRCQAETSTADFYVKDKRTGRRDGVCKRCRISEKKAWIETHRDTHQRHVIAWRKRNPDKCQEILRRFRTKHRERLRAKDREVYGVRRKDKKAAYRAANVDRIKAKNAEYRKRKTADRAAYNAQYYRENKEAVLARIQKSQAAKPDLYNQLHKAAKHRRKVRLLNNGPTETFTDLEIYERDKWRCQLCGEPVNRSLVYPDPKSASLDHVIPIAKGGGHTRVNCQLAHLGCNSSKRDRTTVLF
jgi:hypothetical protein